MSEQASQSALPAHAFPWRTAMPWLVAAGSYLLLLVLSARLLADPDIYWHITAGRWIVEQGAFPHVDPFSATFAGAPWIAKEWLSQLLLAAAYHVAGWNAVAVLTAAAVAAALGVLTWALLEKLDPVASLGFILAAFVLASPHIVARPHALALPVMVLWTAGLIRALDARRAPSLWLLPLMTLWANLHGGFTFGLLLVGAGGLEAVLVAESAERKAAAWRWVRFGVLAVLAACITPYGVESILMTQRILGLGEALALITEWQPQDFSSFGAFEACLLGAIGLALYRGLTLPPVRILVVLGLLHMALAHVRNAELLALVVPLFVAKPLRDQLWPDQRDEQAHLSPGIVAGLVGVIALATGLAATLAIAPSHQVTPAAAVTALKRETTGPVLNDYSFGGYLIHAGVAPFIDGRSELYGGSFIARHHRAVALQDLPGFLGLLEQYKIGATLFAPDRPAVALLDRLPQWERLYADDVAVVHVRKVAAAR
jgi:hypothetical protein